MRRGGQVQLEVRVASAGERAASRREGATPDVLRLVTENGWSAASFALALVAWRRTRPQPPRVEIRRGGTVVVLTDGSDSPALCSTH
ncbi:effector-associated constant component EACC1 [Streptomyces anulatus]|uniref:effector-associated constant component EACC1 n=1 Tax=Streptomyces anulatus TaxID=1892 RepID=UPI00364A2B01